MIGKMVQAVILVFWLENAFRFKPIDIKGLSTINMLYLVMGGLFFLGLILQRRLPRISPLHKYCFLLILIVLCSIPQKFIIGEIEGIRMMREIIFFKNWLEPYIVFFLLYDLVDDPDTCRAIVWGLILMLMATVVVTLLTVSNIAYIGKIQYERDGAWPVFAEPNEYSAFLVLLIPVLLSFLILEKRYWLKLVMIGFSVLAFAALVSTGSRGGFLSCIIALAVYSVYLYRRRILTVGVITVSVGAIVLIIIAGFFLAPDRVREKTVSRVEGEEAADLNEYSSGRLDIWTNAFHLFVQRPFIGHGLNSFPSLNRQVFGLKYGAHSEYLTYLVDHGGFGLLTFIAIRYSIFLYVSRHLKRTRDDFGRLLLLSYLCGFVGYSVGILTVRIFNIHLAFWIYTGVVYAYCRTEETKAVRSKELPNPNDWMETAPSRSLS
jgi:O-antigen ligase